LEKKTLADLLADVVGRDNIKIDEPMKNHTSFKVGGPADILVTPANTQMMIEVLDICKKSGVRPFVMGNGTNLVVRDKGIRGVVVKICENMNDCNVKDECIEADAGILLSRLSKVALEHGLSGLEFASGIPGTLGGAIVMNAGAYDGQMQDVVVETHYIDMDGNMRVLRGDEHQFSYRSSIIQKQGGIVTKAVLKLKKKDKASIKQRMDELNAKRKNSQPLELPSAGSVFKRPVGYYAGKLIEDCGLRGYRIGGAQVSVKHCGFIVNNSGASAQDIIDLIKYIQNEVKIKYNVELETEVKIIGEE